MEQNPFALIDRLERDLDRVKRVVAAGTGGGGGGATNLDGLTDVVITAPASGEVLRHNGTDWVDAALVKADVGLGNVDNTSDADKPVSTAQATANTADRARANHTGTQLASTVSDFDTQVRTSKIHQMTTPTAATPMGGQTFTGLGAGSAAGHSLRYEQLFVATTVTLLGSLSAPGSLIANAAGTYRTEQSPVAFSVYNNAKSFSMAGMGSAGLAFGDGDGLADWELTRTAASVMQLGAGDTIRSQTDASHAEDLVRKSQMDTVQTSVTDHVSDATAAHAGTAISIDSTNLVGTGVNAQAVLDELDNYIVAHEALTATAHGGIVKTSGAQSISGNKQFTDLVTFEQITKTATPFTLASDGTAEQFIAMAAGSSVGNLPSTPNQGWWHVFCNVDTTAKTIGRNLKNIDGVAADYTLAPGETVQFWYHGATHQWRTTSVGRSQIKKAGTLIGTRRGLNLIEGTGITLTMADDAANEEVDVTIAAAATSGIPATIGDAKGDLIGFSADDTAVRIAAAAANGYLPLSDSAATAGIKWAGDDAIAWRTIHISSGSLVPANTVGTWFPTYTGAAGATGGLSPLPVYYIAAADYAVAGRTTQLRVVADLISNAVALGASNTLTLGLYPMTPAGGGAGSLTYTVGSVVTGSTSAVTNLAANTRNTRSASLTLPADGLYAIGIAISGAVMATSSAVAIMARLQISHTA